MSDSQSSKQNADSRPWHCHACNCFNARTNLKCVLCGVERLPHETTTVNPFDHAAIMGDPGNRRISMSFEKQEQYEAALAFLDMGDSPEEPREASAPLICVNGKAALFSDGTFPDDTTRKQS